MDNIWYYAEGDKSVGPLSLADMAAALSRVSNGSSVLVWRDGFPSWVKAGSVAELATHIIKPPPLPVSPRISSQKALPDPTLPIIVGEVRGTPETNKNDLVGIGGWLILVAIGQILGPLKYIAFLFNYYTNLQSDLWMKFPITFYGEAALNISLLAIVLYTVYLFFTKSRLFPKFFIYQYVGSILLLPLDVIFTAATLNAYTGQSVAVLVGKMMTAELVGQWVVVIISAAIWIPYIKLSKRVANTFR
jgi:hypothetical protein